MANIFCLDSMFGSKPEPPPVQYPSQYPQGGYVGNPNGAGGPAGPGGSVALEANAMQHQPHGDGYKAEPVAASPHEEPNEKLPENVGEAPEHAPA